jgi:ribosomal protein L28
MSPKCEICKKGRMKVGRRVKLRGRYNLTTTRFQKPNLHYFKLPTGEEILICSKCRKKLKKELKKVKA